MITIEIPEDKAEIFKMMLDMMYNNLEATEKLLTDASDISPFGIKDCQDIVYSVMQQLST